MLWDVGIIGAGAAGLAAAIMAARLNLKVLLLDGKEKIGAKILMSGGTRCNLTNKIVSEKDFESETKRTIRNILRSFTSEQAIRFFKELGVETVIEEGGKYFPSTHSGKTVLDALVKEVRKLNISLEVPRRVASVIFENGNFKIKGSDCSFTTKSIILATGGLSFPSTGSDGIGYEIAKSFGHHLIPTLPALTPLCTNDSDWKALSGITLPAKLTLVTNGEKVVEYQDSFLFTHVGFSGPSVLNMSRHWISAQQKTREIELRANFLPNLTGNEFRNLISEAAQKHPGRLVENWLSEKLPERLVRVLMKKANCQFSISLNQFNREMREKIVESITSTVLDVSGSLGYAKAEVTAGGIDLSEVDSKTLESKLQPGLFFAGEILDVDGRIGGFNFQWAWASSHAASHGVSKHVKGIVTNAT